MVKIVEIFTDGACSPNPGVGGWGVVLKYGPHVKELRGGELETTNNRMEITAAIKGLEALKRPCQVVVTTDSQYLSKAFNAGWLESWKAYNWTSSSGNPVKNRDLWQRLDELTQMHDVKWIWVRGHSGHAGNEAADELAARALREMQHR